METHLRCSTTLISKRLWNRSHSSTCVSTILLDLQTSQNWRGSSNWKACSSRTTTSTVSSRFQNLKHLPIWWVYQLRRTKCPTLSFSGPSLSTDSRMSSRSMTKLFLIVTSSVHANNSSTSTKFCLLQLSSHQLLAKRVTRKNRKKTDKQPSSHSAYKQRRTQRLVKISSLIWRSIALVVTRG